jgi:feruloyl esterase
LAALLLAALPTAGLTATTVDGAKACAGLAGAKVQASAFALPTGEASVSEARLVPAAGALPEFCRVKGAIAAVGAGDPAILFQVNLPSRWNGKTVQYGGGGYNGVVVDAAGPFKGGALAPPALVRGYATYGSDSGHQTPGASFYDNPQATSNYAHEAVKRSLDLTRSLLKTYYGEAPTRNYHIGGSKGGQEALQAAQRYAADFDGVVSFYPAAQTMSLRLGWNRLWHFAFNPAGGSLDTRQQQVLKAAVMAACDGLDGAVDGVVSNTAACERAFRVDSLRCPEPTNTGADCLNDRQLLALKIAARPFDFAHPMPNGVSSIGPWPALIGGDLALWFGTGADGSQQGFYRGSKVIPEALETADIPLADWRARVLPLPLIFDASNPDLDRFKAKGGKLLLLQGTTDMLVPTPMTTHYFEALTRRYGAGLKDFARYYVVPGYGHGNGAFNMSWDSLAALDAWVEGGGAPVAPVAVDANADSGGRQRPLCEYPAWPKYRGSGDMGRADSFDCVTR